MSYKPSINHPEPSNQYLDHFGEFWNTFPRRVGKRKAEAAFIKACGRAPVEDILAGAQRLADDPNLPEKQFVPHPTTWLNRDGWDDDPLPARNAGPEARQNAPEHRYGTSVQDWLQNPPNKPTGPDYTHGHTIIDVEP
ncbi:hypothetical protein [Corynebacterium renale]|uniref:hypothetical protein n=1 Tax=Corynebacterium renale TaxID=1724 RepID=UPI000E01C84E|nr:hypothetical protein [Corynebacterium renale]STD70279.1 Uncharacterised protein [Corynebacterium renale]